MLASSLARHHDELYADFQQWYGIDLFELDLSDDGRDVRRAAILAAQLPQGSRTARAENPLSGITETDYLVRRIEYNQRLAAYGQTEDAKNKVNVPEPVLFEGEEDAYAAMAAAEERESERVASLLGIFGTEVDDG